MNFVGGMVKSGLVNNNLGIIVIVILYFMYIYCECGGDGRFAFTVVAYDFQPSGHVRFVEFWLQVVVGKIPI